MKIIRLSPIFDSFRVAQIRGMFDVPDRTEITQEWDVSLPLQEREWLIGLIIGPSGSGKTTIAREAFRNVYIHESFDWPEKASVLDGFAKELKTKEIVETLASVGLSSPPHWLKPFAHLSNGQKFRAELARVILSGHKQVVFDEFTSIVDRDVAKICSATLAKTIRRRQSPQFIAVSCHFDVLDWLQPDWVYEVGSNRFEWRSLQRRPDIELRIYETDVSTWQLFRGHHYLSADISKAARCFVATWQERPVAFCAVLHFPHPHVANFKREHRTVVLPDYQGIGIGNALSETIGEFFLHKGFRFISCTSHPAMIWHRKRSPLWRCSRHVGHVSGGTKTSDQGLRKTLSQQRLTAGFEYIGKKAPAHPIGNQSPAGRRRNSPDTEIAPSYNQRHEENSLYDADAQMVRRNSAGPEKARVSEDDAVLGEAIEGQAL